MRGKRLAILLALAHPGFGAENVDSTGLNPAAVLNANGSAFMRQKHYAEAEVTYRAALQACEKADGNGSCQEIPVILSNLGAAYFHLGRFRESELHLVRALTYWPNNPKPSEDLRNTLYNLAAVYRTQAKYEEAVPFYERALAESERLVGPANLSTLPLLNGMAQLYTDTAQYTRAQQILERAVSIIQLRHAESTVDAATSFAALGGVLEAQGKVNDAQTWLVRALDARKRLFGPNDPLVADTEIGLALVYQRQSRLSEAADLNLSAIAAYQERHETKNLPAALHNLGRIRSEEGQLKDAEQLFRKAISLWEQQLGPGHPDVAAGLTSLGLLLCSRGKFNEADPVLRRARDIDQVHFPASHPRVANDLNNLAVLALDRKHYTDAEALFQEAEAILEKCLSPSHPETGKVLARLAEVYHREARLEESQALYRRALGILEQAWGAENPSLLALLEDYSVVLRSQNNYADAASVDARTMKIRVKQALRTEGSHRDSLRHARFGE